MNASITLYAVFIMSNFETFIKRDGHTQSKFSFNFILQ